MTHKKVHANLKPINVMQFDSVSEAQTILPEALLLQFINSAYRNLQMIKFLDAMKERR